MKTFSIKTRRLIAQSAVRSEMRRHKWQMLTADEALQVLDDLLRIEPKLIASQWYAKASNTQLVEFKREWKTAGRIR